jgi:hypothetical protein
MGTSATNIKCILKEKFKSGRPRTDGWMDGWMKYKFWNADDSNKCLYPTCTSCRDNIAEDDIRL